MPLELTDPERAPDAVYERLRAALWSWRGVAGKGVAFRNIGVIDDASYAVDARNTGSGALGLRARADAHAFTVNGSGITATSLTVSGNLTVGGDATIGDDLTVTDDATIGDDLSVGGDLLFPNTGSRVQANLSAATPADRLLVQTNVANGNTNVGAIPNGTSQNAYWLAYNNATPASASAEVYYGADANGGIVYVGTRTGSYLPLNLYTSNVLQAALDTNGRLVVGNGGVALTSATDDKVDVVGGALHIATDATGGGDEIAQGWRYGAAGTTYGLYVTAATDPELVFKDDGGVETVRFGDSTDTYQLKVTGDMNVTDDLIVTGDVSGAVLIAGATTLSGTEELRVVGQSRLEGLLTVTTGGAAITGDVTVTGNLTISGAGNDLTVGDDVTVNGDFTANGPSTFANSVTLSGSNDLTVGGDLTVSGATTLAGNFAAFGGTPVAQPTVGGVRTGTLAQLQDVIRDLLDALDSTNLNLINNTTT